MRTTSISSIRYEPAPVPDVSDPQALRRHMGEQDERIAAVVALLAAGHLEPQPAPPAKPRPGNVRYADGVNWNPGSGEGVYVFKSTGTWAFLG